MTGSKDIAPPFPADSTGDTAAGVVASLDSATRDRNAWIELDAAALQSNHEAIRTWIGRRTEIISVVKANAYGHGAPQAVAMLEAAGTDRYATVWVDEAVALRGAGATRPIIVLGHAFPSDAEAAVAHRLTLTVHSRELGQALSEAASSAGATATVHIKVDTGLHRFGVTPHEARVLAAELRCLPAIEIEGLWTHMANADEESDAYSDAQLDSFAAVARDLSWISYRHVSNSATALRRPDLPFHGVRIGLGQWGYRPGRWVPGPEMTPVLSLRARLARVLRLAPGQGVAYGLTWAAGKPSTIGLVPIGYGDGWRRSLGNRGEVLVQGKRVPMVGRVMMDHFCVDLTALPDTREGEEVTLIGAQGGECIDAAELAAMLDTIPYEVVTALQSRLPRFAHRGGDLVAE